MVIEIRVSGENCSYIFMNMNAVVKSVML